MFDDETGEGVPPPPSPPNIDGSRARKIWPAPAAEALFPPPPELLLLFEGVFFFSMAGADPPDA